MRLSRTRIVLGLLAGAVLGALLTTALYEILYFYRVGVFASGAVLIFIIALVIWTFGLCVIAPLPWRFLHRRGLRRWYHAALFGAVLAFATNTSVFIALDLGSEPPQLPRFGVTPFLGELLPLLPIGAVVGIIVWWTAYKGNAVKNASHPTVSISRKEVDTKPKIQFTGTLSSERYYTDTILHHYRTDDVAFYFDADFINSERIDGKDIYDVVVRWIGKYHPQLTNQIDVPNIEQVREHISAFFKEQGLWPARNPARDVYFE